MPDIFQVPRQAVQAFERTTGLRVAIHDLSGQWHNYLPPDRFVHSAPLCMAVKARHQEACVAFDVQRTRAGLREQPDGRVQVCHAGLVECVVPVYQGARLEWVLFAGQRLPGPRLTRVDRDPAPKLAVKPWARDEPMPEPVSDPEAQALLEMLRQLASRLREWRQTLEGSVLAPAEGKSRPVSDTGTRRTAILRFIQNRHAQPVSLADLAQYLHLSESRAGHAVREACGEPFIGLLIAARLETAAALLRHSNLPILEVALRCGFGDLSNFHHAFRRKFHRTPHRYRRMTQAGKRRGGAV